jgi:thiol-disulfide isomerase/thioredoxin
VCIIEYFIFKVLDDIKLNKYKTKPYALPMHKPRWLITLILIIINFSNAYSADIIIKYIIEKDSTQHSSNSVSDYVLDIIKNGKDVIDLNSRAKLPKNRTVISITPNQEVVIISYKLSKSGIYYLTDLLGHELLLDQSMDGDTIVLNLHIPDKNHIMKLNDTVKRTSYYDITYPEKYKYMGFFDGLVQLHGNLGRIGGGYLFKEMNQDVVKYLGRVNQVYADKLRFYYDFIKKNYMPERLKYYTLKEIQYSYYDDITDPLVVWDGRLIKEYPVAIRDSIKKIAQNLNDKDLFENTTFYRRVTVDYLNLTAFQNGNITALKDAADSSLVTSQLQFCKKNFAGFTKNYALAYLMQISSRHNWPATFSELYNNYDHSNSTPGTNALVDSLNTMMKNAGNMNEGEVLNLSFEDTNHKKIKLGELFNKDIVVLDCWATWCVPCIEQIPALNALTDEFKDRVQFISISADQLLSKWDNWMAKDHRGNKSILQIHAQNGFQNMFFSRLMINAIPRYILVSKSGKILNMTMPYPSQKEEFKAELKKYL